MSRSRCIPRRAHIGALIALLAGLCASPLAVAADILRISGTGSALGGMHLVAEAFMQAHPGARVQVQPAIGSSGSINAVAAGKLDIGLSSSEPDAATRAKAQVTATEYARTPLVVAVHRKLGLSAITSAQLAAWFEPGATFANGQRVRPILRGNDTTEFRFMRSLSPAVASAVDAAAARRGMLEATTDTEEADLIEETPGGFGSSTLALVASERRALVALTLDGREPTLDNLAKGAYPYQKRLFAITQQAPSAAVTQFLAFLRSPAAQALLRAHGHLTP